MNDSTDMNNNDQCIEIYLFPQGIKIGSTNMNGNDQCMEIYYCPRENKINFEILCLIYKEFLKSRY